MKSTLLSLKKPNLVHSVFDVNKSWKIKWLNQTMIQ